MSKHDIDIFTKISSEQVRFYGHF